MSTDLVAAALAEIPRFVSATTLFQNAVADQLGVPPGDLHCLNLVGTGEADTPTALAERMGMTTGAVTKMLDRMEENRFVRREPHPDDRRRVVIRPLPDRAEELAALYEPMARFLTEEIARFEEEQLRFLVEFARTAREVAVRETLQLRKAGRSHATRARGTR
ncbi:MarR family transcriptional regulator [Nonomuraea sp. NN258]|uniref:MarR family transcriptional regulator n=1 Tax=Nonomuraea antri TaxID=2730852 RepID=UPI001569C15C|nr:MarR family transcriptional regulator [Nonomuraea antri]NRQ35275.1 MarR family transcriptional regulator [Nonomuraea antri]